MDLKSVMIFAGAVPGLGNAMLREIRGKQAQTESLRDQVDLTAFIAALAGKKISLKESADAWEQFQSVREQLERGDFYIVIKESPGYPPPLASIPSAPELLYIKGKPGVLSELDRWNTVNATAIVGCRTPSPFGIKEATRIAARLAAAGEWIVSGLALGCDTAAHVGALSVSGKTIAALPCGLDNVYPPANRELAGRIADGGGVLITEYPPGTIARKPHLFINRNRLQSGLSRRVLVIETDIKGGTLYTVDFAKKQGREVCVLDSHRGVQREYPTYRGNLMLVEQGWGRPFSE